MDANVFIKSVTVEGNKIKNIQFDGDWNIEVGGGGEAPTQYVFADGNLVVDAEDSFISVSKSPVSNDLVYITISFLTDAGVTTGLGQVYRDIEFMMTNYRLLAGSDSMVIPAGTSKTISINLSTIANTVISLILTTNDSLVKVYKFHKTWLAQL